MELNLLNCFICGNIPKPSKCSRSSVKKRYEELVSELEDLSRCMCRLFNFDIDQLTKNQGRMLLTSSQVYCQKCCDNLQVIVTIYQQLDRLNNELNEVGRRVWKELNSTVEKHQVNQVDPLLSDDIETELIQLQRAVLNSGSDIFRLRTERTGTFLSATQAEDAPLDQCEPINIKVESDVWNYFDEDDDQSCSQASHDELPTTTIPLNPLESTSSPYEREHQDQYIQEKSKCNAISRTRVRARVRKKSTKKHRCEQCEKEFSTSTSLRVHQRIHTGEMPYECSTCKKRFSHKSNYKRHITIHDPSARSFICEHENCGKAFRLRENWKAHVFTHSTDPIIRCYICGKRFPDTSLLDQHKQKLGHIRGLNKDKNKCKHCQKEFTRAASLRVHERVHSGERPYQYKTCGQQFRFQSVYANHLKTHDPVKAFVCEVCGKSCTTRITLKDHMHVHTKEAPHRCKVCGRRFADPNLLKEHRIQSHTTEEIEIAHGKRKRPNQKIQKNNQDILMKASMQ